MPLVQPNGDKVNELRSVEGAAVRTTSSFIFSMEDPGRGFGGCQRGVRSDERQRCLFSRPIATPCAVERRLFWGERFLSPGGGAGQPVALFGRKQDGTRPIASGQAGTRGRVS